MSSPRKLAALVLGMGVLAASAGGVPRSAAAHTALPVETVICGQTITTSLRVANNLAACAGHGLVVGAPSITIDLGGHRLGGTGDVGEYGIDNSAGHDGVVVRNGVLAGFSTGIWFIDADDSVISGIQIWDSANHGMLLSGSERNTLANNVVGRSVNYGINIDSSSSSNLLKGNTLTENGNSGILVAGSSDSNILKGNTATGNGFGIFVSGASSNTLKGNVARGNLLLGISLAAFSTDNVLRGNSASGNGTSGFYVSDGSDRNLLQGNSGTGNAGDGISTTGASDNVLTGNRFEGNDADGIAVTGGTGNSFRGNRVSENGVRGISSDTSALTLEGNTANRNGFLGGGPGDDVGLGIEVPAGTTSGGNKATGNDDPNECEAADVTCHVP